MNSKRSAFVHGWISESRAIKTRWIYIPITIITSHSSIRKTTDQWIGMQVQRYQWKTMFICGPISTAMRDHCRIHQWKCIREVRNPRREDRVKEFPWEENIHCERVFERRLYSSNFAVASQPIEVHAETPMLESRRWSRAGLTRPRKRNDKRLKSQTACDSPIVGCERSDGYIIWRQRTPEKLRSLIRPEDEGEGMLAIIHASFKRVIRACKVHQPRRL